VSGNNGPVARYDCCMRNVMKAALCVSTMAFVLGCTVGRPRAGVASEAATVAVDNRGFSDMTIYVSESPGSRRRLGLATGVSTSVFTIPSNIVGNGRELMFIVDPIGSSRTGTSNSMYVQPGQRVTLTIPP
jgi:hypothetical protein